MTEFYFTFRTLTAGQRGARLLTQSGISARLIRAPQAISQQGCGYALLLAASDAPAAASRLRGAALPYSASYELQPDGSMRAVAL